MSARSPLAGTFTPHLSRHTAVLFFRGGNPYVGVATNVLQSRVTSTLHRRFAGHTWNSPAVGQQPSVTVPKWGEDPMLRPHSDEDCTRNAVRAPPLQRAHLRVENSSEKHCRFPHGLPRLFRVWVHNHWPLYYICRLQHPALSFPTRLDGRPGSKPLTQGGVLPFECIPPSEVFLQR